MFESIAHLSAVKFPVFRDERGALISIEMEKAIPFKVARVFWIFDVPADKQRGGHAHKACQQFMVCSSGSVSLEISDGNTSRVLALEEGMAVHVPPAIFVTVQFGRPGSILTVFCDQPYIVNDYIRDLGTLNSFRSTGSGGK
jgi:dTDP-4-dehydrorhamnose 3,5-epimerase-like enzyme